MAKENKEENYWQKLFEGMMTGAWTITIGLFSGFGIFYIFSFMLDYNLDQALFRAFPLSTALAMVYFIAEFNNLQRKYRLENIEEDDLNDF